MAVIELTEWHAEAAFKNIAAEAAGALSIQKKSKKEVGRYLSKVLEGRVEEKKKNITGPDGTPTGLELIHSGTWLSDVYAKCGGPH